MMSDKIRELVTRWQKAVERRQNWEPHWQECYNYAFPQRENVSTQQYYDNYGGKQNLHLFDGTAPDAVDQLASSLLSAGFLIAFGVDPALGQMVWFESRSGVERARAQSGSPDFRKKYRCATAKF